MENRKNLKTSLFTINFESNFIEINDGDRIKITHIEANVLNLLFTNPDVVYSRDDILNHAWHDNSNNYDSVVPQTISLLRKKLHKYNIDAIETVKGQGYKANNNILKDGKSTIKIPKVNRTILSLLVLSLLILTIFLAFKAYNKNKIPPPIKQTLEARSKNLNILSTSLPIVVDHSLLKNDINYFINRSEKIISLSACKKESNTCSSIYNELIFYTDEFDINNKISNIIFEDDIPDVFHNNDGKFSAVSKIKLSSSDNSDYHGLTYINVDVKTKNKDFFITEFSNSTAESGYSGHYNINTSLNMSLVSKIKNNIKYKYIYKTKLKDEYDSLAKSRSHFGMIQEQNNTLLYNFIFDKGRQSTYKHYYPIFDNIGYLYQENYDSGVLIFTYD
ncbi:winged helix-turn-helix domain-containing protein [Aliivibrio sp. EL58]|uniref:winged helix-turn-helix domain-containing protein n=1 Tax=Aliivibrio sp. EL58 TaxID=2107582 RepID=UPI000EFA5360|nr:winged helix-turn-helix domain-containing protein [Aliivibrio sp. EL58]